MLISTKGRYALRVLIDMAEHGSGGYRLAVEPRDCTVGRVLRLTEESLAPVACLEEGAAACPRTGGCRTLAMWQGLDNVITEYLDGITLADLLQKDG